VKYLSAPLYWLNGAHEMNTPHPARRRLDVVSLEIIVVVILNALHDLLLSNTLSLPLVLRHSTFAQLRALDIVASGLDSGRRFFCLLPC